MSEPAQSLESVVRDMAERIGRLEARVAVLEGRRGPAAAPAVKAVAAADGAAVEAPAVPTGVLALIGRTLLVLAGAYLVRALTDARALPAALGVALGLAYAVVFQLVADREARQGRHASAVFHDVASSAIAFPLIWEATARFALIPPHAAFAALVAFFALGIGVAWHRRLRANAVVTTFLALATAVALLASTLDLVSAMAALLAIAAGVEWLAWRGAWLGLRWAAAAVLDAAAALVVVVATRPAWPDGYAAVPIGLVEAVLLALPALYVASVAARTLRRGEAVTLFEVVQGSLALLLGVAGALRVLEAHGMAAAGPAALALLLGVLCYGAAFEFAERRPGQGRNFYLYSTAGGLLTLAGTALLAGAGGRPLIWSSLGLAVAWIGRHFGRATLRAHSALYLAAAALSSGLAAGGSRALGGVESVGLTPVAWAAALAAVVAWAVLATDEGAARSGLARTPQLLLALLGVLAVGSAVQAAAWLALGPRLEADPGAVAVVRTAVLAGLALFLALAGARFGFAELRWLVYPVVAAGGLKLLTQDLRHGRPATLVASLAVYGLVLILLPRLSRLGGQPSPDGPGPVVN
jgi:hypothetical protein